MAAPKRKSYYSEGNAAYDLTNYGGVNVVRQLEYQLPEQQQPQPQKKQRTQAKSRSQVPVSAIMGFAVATAMLLLVVFSYVRLYELSSQSAALQNQLAELKAQNEQMVAHYANTIDLNAVSLIATSQLGMSRPAKDQIVYVDLGNEDKAEIIDDEGENAFSALLEALSDSIAYIKAYFS